MKEEQKCMINRIKYVAICKYMEEEKVAKFIDAFEILLRDFPEIESINTKEEQWIQTS